ncbi:MAG: glycosyltransferase [Patescibacteria group bacterium]|nr:glycosyltransferase [Patescibacteria group bacterium]
MKLLIATQKVDMNDAVLGFFHSWLKEFACRVDFLTVVCLYEGQHDLPDNVKVLSLGKENNKQFSIFNFQFSNNFQFLNKLKYTFLFFRYIWQERNNYDKLFIHMNPEYIVLGGVFWKIWKKKISLWYVHRATPWQLRIAEKFVDVIFTASKESFQLKSNKVKVVGHGISLDKVKDERCKMQDTNKFQDTNFKILYVGRISRIKNQGLLIRAIDILDDKNVQVQLVGAPLNFDDEKYKEELKNLVKKNNLENQIEFVGAVPNKDIVKYYSEANLAINLCPSGGMDKAVLEAMACKLPVMVLNKTFAELIGEEDLVLKTDDAEELIGKIGRVMSWNQDKIRDTGERLKKLVKDKYGLDNLVKKIINVI